MNTIQTSRQSMNPRVARLSVFSGVLLTLLSPQLGQAQREDLARGFAKPQQFTISLKEARGRSKDGVPGIDVSQARATNRVGFVGFWHYHPGPALIIVKSGTFKLTEDEEGCPSTEYPAGSVIFEDGFHVHRPSNPASEETVIYVTFFVPPGVPDQTNVEPTFCHE